MEYLSIPTVRGMERMRLLRHLISDPLDAFRQAIKYGDALRIPFTKNNSIYLFWHPDHLEHMLQRHYKRYVKGANMAAVGQLVGMQGLVMSEGQSWLFQRRLMQPAFHRQRLAGFAQAMVEETQRVMASWPINESFDMTLEMMGLTQAIIVRTMFGTSLLPEQTQSLCRDLNEALAYISNTLLFFWLPQNLLPGYRAFKRAVARLDSTIESIIQRRREEPGNHDDLLGMLIAAQDADSGERMTDAQLRDEVKTIFVTGNETTSNAMTWCWAMLAQHPRIADALESEVQAIIGDEQPQLDHLRSFDLVARVIQETLRLWPSAPVFFRTPIDDDVLPVPGQPNAGYKLPKGSISIICPYTTHRMPELWSNPETFDPERFPAALAKNRPAFAYAPFSGGPRGCIGNEFAMMEAQIILATISRSFQIKLANPKQDLRPQLKTTLHIRHGLPVIAQRR